MSDRLQVKNFGPLKDINMELKDFTVLIGPQGVGKSAIAKLVLIKNESIAPNKSFIEASLVTNKIPWITERTEMSWNDSNILSGTESAFFSPDRKSLDDFNVHIKNSILHLRKILASLKGDYFEWKGKSSWSEFVNDIQDAPDILLNIIDRERVTNVRLARKLDYLIDEIKRDAESLNSESNKAEGNKVKKTTAILAERLLGNFMLYNSTLKLAHKINPQYIPAERGFLPSISGLTLNLMQNKVPLAPGLLDFGATFEKARIAIPHFQTPLLGISYKYEGGKDMIYLKDNTAIDLKDAASGFQTIVPLMLVVEYLTLDKEVGPHYFIIEEPELNLYPSTQKALVEWLVMKCKESNSKLLMTTHSPYVLTALNNLVKAGEVAKSRPEETKNINKIVKKDYWLNYEDVGVYYINKGKAKNLMSKTNRMIDATAIDDVSDILDVAFNKLLDIQYSEQ